MTTAGAERLRAELQRLKTVERPTIVRAIGEARLHGDISENAEYHAAKERQGFIEARIRDIESKLADAHVVNPAEIDAGGKIVFGATVDLVDLASGDKVSYQIVGLVLSRDVRVLEKDDPPAAILEDFQSDFGIAAQRSGVEALCPWCVRR